MAKQSRWSLPAGHIDTQGVVHRAVELTTLTGREEELLATSTESTAALVTEVLHRCVTRIGDIHPVTPQILRELVVGDRQYLMLMLRQLTFGNRVQATLPCPWPNCGKGVDVDFRISDIPVTPCDIRPQYRLEIDRDIASEISGSDTHQPLTVNYRLPNGGDQEALSDAIENNQAGALSTLLSRCVLSVGTVENPSADWLSQLPAGFRQRIEQDMEGRAPNVELIMEATCPECERDFTAPFSLQDFFFGELKAGTEFLFREIHYLAFHYHWSEQNILNMPRNRRRRYIDILSNEIESMNEQSEF